MNFYSDNIFVQELTSTPTFSSPFKPRKINSNLINMKDSSDSSIDDDAYLDDQEEPMTDQQSQNNQNSAVPAGAGNTLPIKSTGNTARSVNL